MYTWLKGMLGGLGIAVLVAAVAVVGTVAVPATAQPVATASSKVVNQVKTALGLSKRAARSANQAHRRAIVAIRQARAARRQAAQPGPPGPRGPTGPRGPRGSEGAGSGLNLNFNAKLDANEVKQTKVGNFTLRVSTNLNGDCSNIQLLIGDTAGRVSIGSGGGFTSQSSNSSVAIQTGNTSNMFTAVTANGNSTISGIVGRANQGGFCLVSGYVTGA